MAKLHFFKDAQRNLELEEKGYSVFDCFSDSQVASLLKLYKKEKPFLWRKPVYCNAFFNKKEKNNRINDQLVTALRECPSINLDAIEVLGGCFISKMGPRNNEVGFHQDWTITDESQTESYLVWVPLVDTTIQNGAMATLPQTYKYFKNTLRSLSVQSLYIPLLDKYSDKIKVMTLKAGQGMIYSSALFHGSFKNNTKADRVALTTVVIPKGTERIYYHYDKSTGKTYQMRMPHNFHINYQPRLTKLKLENELEVLKVWETPNTMLTESEVMNISTIS